MDLACEILCLRLQEPKIPWAQGGEITNHKKQPSPRRRNQPVMSDVDPVWDLCVLNARTQQT